MSQVGMVMQQAAYSLILLLGEADGDSSAMCGAVQCMFELLGAPCSSSSEVPSSLQQLGAPGERSEPWCPRSAPTWCPCNAPTWCPRSAQHSTGRVPCRALLACPNTSTGLLNPQPLNPYLLPTPHPLNLSTPKPLSTKPLSTKPLCTPKPCTPHPPSPCHTPPLPPLQVCWASPPYAPSPSPPPR